MADVRNLPIMAMADKTFTIVFIAPGDYQGNRKATTFTGTLELEGSFAIVREWKEVINLKGDGPSTTKQLIGIHVIPAHTILSIDWIPAPVVKLDPHDPHRA